MGWFESETGEAIYEAKPRRRPKWESAADRDEGLLVARLKGRTVEHLAEREEVSPRTIRNRLTSAKDRLVPRPDLIVFGCRPLVPNHGYDLDAMFHAPPIGPEDVGDRPWPQDARCWCCRGEMRSGEGEDLDADTTIAACGWCASMGEPWDGHASVQRRLHEARVRTGEARERVNEEAIGVIAHEEILTELERRRIWNGYTNGSRLEAIPEDSLRFTSRAKVGRDWLRTIGQEPDYDIVLDTKGKVLGRYSEGWTPPDEWIDAAAA